MSNPKVNKSGWTFSAKMTDESLIMARYALGKGLKVPSWIVERLKLVAFLSDNQPKLPDLSADGIAKGQDDALLHATLSELVTPATPASIELTEGVGGFFKFKGMKVMTGMTWAGIISLALFLLTLGSKGAQAVVSGDTPWYLTATFLSQVNLLASAGLGASFYALFVANIYIVNRTYDPSYAATYWVRFFLGIIAGVILANLAPNLFSLGNGSAADWLQSWSPSAISLFGGYSAGVVNKILKRLVDMLVTLVEGTSKEIVEARSKELKAEFSARDKTQRLQTAISLVKLGGSETGLTDSGKQTLDRLVKDLVGEVPATPVK